MICEEGKAMSMEGEGQAYEHETLEIRGTDWA